MKNIEEYLTKAEIEINQALREEDKSKITLLHEEQAQVYHSVIYHALKATYYQNQAIIELLKERETK